MICTNTNILFLCCFVVGCLGGGVGSGDAYYLFTKLEDFELWFEL